MAVQTVSDRQSGGDVGTTPSRIRYVAVCAGHFEQNLTGLATHALRIGPNELHLTDVSKYKTIYNQSRPFPKQKAFYDGFGTPHTVFVESDLALRKERRRLLNPFFSRVGILRIESTLHTHIRNLQVKLVRLSEQRKPIVAQNAFRCVTVDIVSDFAFAKSRHIVEDSDDEFHAEFLAKFDAVAEIFWDSVYSPVLRQVGTFLPRAVAETMSRPLKNIFALADEAQASLDAYKSTVPKDNKPVLFDGLKDLSDDLATAEAIDILVAGSDTTAFTLVCGVRHICSNPKVKMKLAAALKEKFPDSQPDSYPGMLNLESVPYLTACVKESLRLAMAVPGRLPRTVPSDASKVFAVDGKPIPPGATVRMSAYTMHFSEELWGDDARVFNPNRWLDESSKGLDAHLVTFSKGARSCIGQNLAHAELMVMLYMLFRNFNVELDPSTTNSFASRDVFTQAVENPGLLLRLQRLT